MKGDRYRMPVQAPHPFYPGESGTQCVGCWGWVDDPRHTTRMPIPPVRNVTPVKSTINLVWGNRR